MRRRHFLQAAGISLTLPALESLGGAADLEGAAKAKRLFLMTDGYGFHPPVFFPAKTGPDFPSNDVIKSLDPLRAHVSILGNLNHLHGHSNQMYVATGTPKSPRFSDSVDQYAARHLSHRVPLDSLLLSTHNRATGGSFRGKVPVSMMYDVEEIFDHLFVKRDVATRARQLERQQSVLDLCLGEAKSLSQQVSTADRKRLDDYLNSVRETELVVKKDVQFLNDPAIDPGFAKADFVPQAEANSEQYFAYVRSLMRFVELAFKFDLTRVAYLWEGGQMHGATHHGGRAVSVAALTSYATSTVDTIASSLTSMKETKMPDGSSLLDETLFVWTAALGDAAKHTGKRVPAIIAGGRLKRHGSYEQLEEPQDLSSLYLAVLHQLGVDAPAFNESTRPLEL